MKKPLTYAIIIALILGGVYLYRSQATKSSIVKVASTDADMNQAIATAVKTFPFFVENYKTMKNDGYSIKVAIPTTDGDHEHIWFSPTRIAGDVIEATCANEPSSRVANLKLGQKRTVQRKEVSDWMILVGTTCYGGYTMRVLDRRDPSHATGLTFVDPP